MAFKKGENPNHPRRGSSIKSSPIRDLKAVQNIKTHLIRLRQERNHCIFTLGINTAWRANELLSLKVRDVRHLGVWGLIELKQSKNQKYRQTPINQNTYRALEIWLAVYDPASDDLPLFPSFKPGYQDKPLTVPALSRLVKEWCDQVGLAGQFASHTMRKTWGYHQRITYNEPLSLLVEAYGHSSESETLLYLGILPEEVSALYENEI